MSKAPISNYSVPDWPQLIYLLVCASFGIIYSTKHSVVVDEGRLIVCFVRIPDARRLSSGF